MIAIKKSISLLVFSILATLTIQSINSASAQPKPQLETSNSSQLQGCDLSLIDAISNNDIKAVREIANCKGYKLEVVDKYGRTALSIAIRQRRWEIVKILVENRYDVNHLSVETNYAPLKFAAHSGNYEIVELLIGKGADIKHKDFTGVTAIYSAVTKDTEDGLKILKLLIDKNADVNIEIKPYWVGRHGSNPLQGAISSHNLGAVKILVENGAKINYQNSFGMTPLLMATTYCGSGALEIIEYLIGNGAIVNFSNNHVVKLMVESVGCSIEEFDQIVDLINAGTKSESTRKIANSHALIKASTDSYYASDRKVEYIISKGVNINFQDRKNRTALQEAVRTNSLDIIKILVANGADVDLVRENNQTPLLRSILTNTFRKDYRVTKFLIEQGADVNKADIFGRTPLIEAIKMGLTEIVELLLLNDADSNQKGANEETPLSIARNPEIIELLQSYGATE